MRKKIIVVDDDPGVQDVFKIIFERAGYDIAIFPSGLSILENKFEQPDLFILDKQLSGVDGLDVCRHLKGSRDMEKIPVIMVSASPDIEKHAKAAGADDFIEKPFNTRDVLQKVAGWLQHN